MERGIAFRAVVADSFYGEDREFKRSLGELGVGYVLALKKSTSRIAGGTCKARSVHYGKRPKLPDGRVPRSREIGRR